MWVATVPFEALRRGERWKAEFFCEPDHPAGGRRGSHPTRVGDLVHERRRSVDPRALGNAEVNYIGLENVQSFTGELVDFAPRPANTVKSRSKVFARGDVLFGRLRPGLNKVWLAGAPVEDGICSTEFLVLVPDPAKVRPIVLRYLLSSADVQGHALRCQTGSALPRVSLDDLMGIEVRLPDREMQLALEKDLLARFGELVELRKRLRQMPEAIQADFMRAVESRDVTPEDRRGPGRCRTGRRAQPCSIAPPVSRQAVLPAAAGPDGPVVP